MFKRRGASPDLCRTPILSLGNLFHFPLAMERAKMQLPTSSMVKRNMHLSGSNHSNLQVQAALTAVSDVIKGVFDS